MSIHDGNENRHFLVVRESNKTAPEYVCKVLMAAHRSSKPREPVRSRLRTLRGTGTPAKQNYVVGPEAEGGALKAF